MITNDFIKGYIQALDNIKSMVDNNIGELDKNFNSGAITADHYLHSKTTYNTVRSYVESVKESYRQLVKEYNQRLPQGPGNGGIDDQGLRKDNK